jgi:uncharacterized protein (TIGR03118 family)
MGRFSRLWRKNCVKCGRGSAKFQRGLESLEPRTVLSTGYLQLSVASDQANSALIQDSNLLGPWGVALNPSDGDLWTADRSSGMASLYLGGVGGSPLHQDAFSVTVPGGSPTGVAANSSAGFVVQSGASSGPASLLFAADGGEISGWNSNVPPPAPSSQAENAATISGADYKGLTLANNGGQNLLYAADFRDGRIDAFNSSFNRITLAGNFADPSLPAGYAPFNIANIGGQLLVSYAVQDATKQNDSPGVGNGIVDAYDYNGNFAGRLITGGPLNSPWGMVLAPANFGDFGGELLVANAGDGKINAFGPTTGAYLGTLSSPTGNPLTINGLHGLSFGNGLTTGDSNALFATAVGNGGQHGLLSEIVSAQNSPFPAQGNVISPVAHVNFSGVVAVFNDAHATGPNGFTALVNWGDGFDSNGTIIALSSGGFAVSSSHGYEVTGQQTITVQIRDSASSTVTATSIANVAPPGLVFTAPTVTATEGMSFSGPVATFIDQDTNGSASLYTTTIDWGDGTTTAGTLSEGYVSPFTLSGTHTYATVGTKPITVTVNDADGATGTEHVNATVVSSLSGSGRTFTPTETMLFSGAVASFTDANSSHNIGNYSATIDWGDGTASPGTISPDASGGYDVTGSHNYGDDGTDNVSVAISDPGSTITVLSTAQVADIDTLSATASPVTADEGVQFSGQVGIFTDTLFSAPASDFAATIDWGDGVTTAGTVTKQSGVFTISGTHTYADFGSFAIDATVRDVGGTATATVQPTANVADSNVLSLAPLTFQAVSGSTFTGAVATMSDAYTGAAASLFHASINWGDGVTTTGTVGGSNGNYTILGAHEYASEGTYAPIVTVADHPPGTANATTTSTADVMAAPPAVTAVAVSGSEQAALVVNVASFTQAGANTTAGDYTATIDWGDGTTSAGTVTAAAPGFAVSGTHTYADEGHYSFSVTVTRNGGTSGNASGTADVVEPMLADGTAGNPTTRWVNEVYGDLLHRPADMGALNYWSGQVSAGVTRSQVVAAIEASEEYRSDEVQAVFEAYLRRAAEPAALSFGTGYLADHTLEQFKILVAGSSEFFQVQGGNTNDGFLDALFQDALNRTVDSGARAYFDGLLSHGVSTAQLAAIVLGSEEYLNDVVQSAYLSYLDRPADTGGANYFVGLLQEGATDAQVAATLIASDEYFAKTAE